MLCLICTNLKKNPLVLKKFLRETYLKMDFVDKTEIPVSWQIKFRRKIMILEDVEECDIGISKTWSIVMEAKCTKCSRKS